MQRLHITINCNFGSLRLLSFQLCSPLVQHRTCISCQLQVRSPSTMCFRRPWRTYKVNSIILICTVLIILIQSAISAPKKSSFKWSKSKVPTADSKIGNSGNSSTSLSEIPAKTRQIEPEPEPTECDGFDNFIEDVGLLTYLFDVLVSAAGIGLLPFAYLAQVYSYISAYTLATPSVLIFLLDEFVPESLEEFFDMLGIGDTLFNILISLPVNDVVNLVAGVVEGVGIANLFMETLGTFPAYLELFMKVFLETDARDYFRDYACGAPKAE